MASTSAPLGGGATAGIQSAANTLSSENQSLLDMHKAMDEVSSNEDRISELPDTILGHILSYVTTKEAVRTSILSKRWSLVWSYVPVLYLDDSSLSSADPYKDQAIHSSFIRFLNNVFNLYEAGSLQMLAVKCSKFDCYHVNKWVMSAMKRRVPHLDLCIINNEHFNIGVPLFAYQDLVDLKLGKDFVLDIPGEVLLPCLKKLHLDCVDFSSDELCRKLLCGCPVLEHLHLNNCYMQSVNVKTLEITAAELKLLVLEDVRAPNNNDFEIVVDAPNLEVLRYSCYMVRGYSFKNLDSLVTADIEVDLKHVDKTQVSDVRETALPLVNGIANAKFITLTGYSLEFLSFLDPTALPIFNKCTELTLGGNKHCGMLLPKFLENSPRLQKLVLAQEIAYEGVFGEFKWHNPAQVPKCLIYSLVSVEIRGYNGQHDMLNLVGYLVSNSKVLVELSSGSNKEGQKEVKVCKQLLSSLLTI